MANTTRLQMAERNARAEFRRIAEPKNRLRLKEGFTPQSPPSQTAQKTLKSLASVPCLELKEKRQDECE